MIHITSNFVWLDITARCDNPQTTRAFAVLHELYEVESDGTDHLIESVKDVPNLIANGAKICIEVGHIDKDSLTPIGKEPTI